MSDSIELKISKIVNSDHKYFNSIWFTSYTILMLEYENDNPNFKHKISFHRGTHSLIEYLYTILKKNTLKIKELDIQEGLFVAPVIFDQSDFKEMEYIYYTNHYPIFVHIRHELIGPQLAIMATRAKYRGTSAINEVYKEFCKQNKNTAYYTGEYYYSFTTLDSLRKEVIISKIMLA